MTKLDLVDAVYRVHGGISRREASALVDAVLGGVKSGIRRGDRVHLSGFGSFDVVWRAPRTGRNPHTGERMTIPARKTLVFRPSRLLLDRLNRVGGEPAEVTSR